MTVKTVKDVIAFRKRVDSALTAPTPSMNTEQLKQKTIDALCLLQYDVTRFLDEMKDTLSYYEYAAATKKFTGK